MKVIKRNSTGIDVIRLQQLLQDHGYNVYDDGVFGPNTDIAVKNFQKKSGLVADGIVGQKTWDKLLIVNKDNTKISKSDFQEISRQLNIETAIIMAIKEVESGPYGGFLSLGYPPILFEGHIFWKQLENEGLYPNNYIKGNNDILYPKWTKQYYLGGMKEYERLNKAIKINENAALKSASWGMFQIMGFNYEACGCKSVKEFVTKMKQSERSQLEMFMQFIINNKLDIYLREKDWAGFAKRYNGPGYAQNKYDTKLEQAYLKYKKEAV